jgi:hypothetical protein
MRSDGLAELQTLEFAEGVAVVSGFPERNKRHAQKERPPLVWVV